MHRRRRLRKFIILPALAGLLMDCENVEELVGSDSGANTSDSCSPKFGLCTAPFPLQLEAADFDGNGSADLVTSGGSPIIDVFLAGTGNGDAKTKHQHKLLFSNVEYERSQVMTCDLDSDGVLDVVSSSFGMTSAMSWIVGAGAEFRPRSIDAEYFVAQSLRCVDWDSDGLPDLVGADLEGSLSIRRGLGNGDFGPISGINIGFKIEEGADVEIVDFTGGGALDLLIRSKTSVATLTMARGYDGRVFDQPVAIGHSLKSILGYLIEDMDNDSIADIALLGVPKCDPPGCQPGRVLLLHATGEPEGGFVEETIADLAEAPNGGRVVDLDGDGRLDMAVGAFPTLEIVLVRIMAGEYIRSSLALDWATTGIAAADFDGDRRIEIAAVHPEIDAVQIYETDIDIP